MEIGFLINPIAGVGGPLGLGGSDGITIEDVKRLNARMVAQDRARSAIRSITLQPCFKDISFLTCSGQMGADVLRELGIMHRAVLEVPPKTERRHTMSAVRKFNKEGAKLIIFIGGDGTARDIYTEIDRELPILGIPSGVKMHSSVFLTTPSDAGLAVQIFVEVHKIVAAEIMDVDEEAFRQGRVSARLYGIASVPDVSELRQSVKSMSGSPTETEELEELAEYFLQSADDRTLYVLGTGSTIGAISRKFGIEKNELTVNAIFEKREVGQRLSEESILALIDKYDSANVVVSPIGGQGFIFGRGNQQLSAKVLSKLSNEDIIVVATPTKLARLKTLRVDTGDDEIDARLRGYWKIMTGYAKFKVVQVQ